MISAHDLNEASRLRFGDPRFAGPLPKAWNRSGYYTPDIYYEALVSKLVGPETHWLDVGCGRELFPENEALAMKLANRCRLLVGLDPMLRFWRTSPSIVTFNPR